MTRKEFKQDLLRGRGRCVQAAQAEPEKYADIVLWGCTQNLSFDAQCEGTRAWLVYRLASCYPDKTPFLKAAEQSLKAAKSDGSWKMLSLAELLHYFYEDGFTCAGQALWGKYDELYERLMSIKSPPRPLFHERDDFGQLCVVLADSKASVLKIAADIGRLYREKTFYDGFDFEWLYDSKSKRYLSSLKKEAKRSEDIAEYLRAGDAEEKRWNEMIKNRPDAPPEKGPALSNWLRRKADKETVLRYAKAYINQRDPEARAEALRAFTICPYPEDPSPVIEDASSGNEKLSETAWRALERIRHPAVREFALSKLQDDAERALPIFIKNYESSDSQLLERLVKSIAVDFDCSTSWHGIHLDVLNMIDDGNKAPAPLLKYICEATYCSCCREHALSQMGRRKMLTDEMLHECLFDSSDDIRAYAARRLKRRANTQ